jgi:hypothetical protein
MNDLVSCPYNQSHKVKQFKILAHIASCKDKKKFQADEFITCRSDVSCRFHVTRKLEHELTCKACQGEELEPGVSGYPQVADNTATKIELNLNQSSTLFGKSTNTKIYQTSDDFYKEGEKKEDPSVINKTNTIIY